MLDVIKNKNGTLTIATTAMNNIHTGTLTLDIASTTDCLYIGHNFPFNSLYFNVTVPNIITSSMIVHYWNGAAWKVASRVIDETDSGGKTLAQSGYITFVPSKNSPWFMQDTVDSSGNEWISGMGSVEIYDKYWMRITFSTSLTATTAAKWIGTKFSNDTDLGVEYPELINSSLIAGYKTGKTTWDEQHILAAQIIENDLKAKNLINDKVQLIEREQLVTSSVSKVAEIIFNGLGQDNQVDVLAARDEYNRRIVSNKFTVDKDADAIVDLDEKRENSAVGRFYRK
jgi:hypothetical protein